MATKSKGNAAAASSSAGWAWLVVALLLILGIMGWYWQKMSLVKLCDTTDLTLTVGQQSGAAGTIYQQMTFTNSSKHKCTVTGYPTAFLVGSDGYALGTGAASRPQPAPTKITLEHDESAAFVLGFPQAGNFDPGICSAKSTNIKIYPPSTTVPFDIPLAAQWCPGFSATAMSTN